MAEETIQILKVDTLQPIKSIGELRQRIKDLKDQLEGLDIGSEGYSETLQQLTGYQAALKNAMHATNRTGEDQEKVLADLTNAAAGTTDSYNGLVRQMAKLTEEYRATTSEMRRKDLAREIKNINEELKKMDAARGIYSRNVGDYFNQLLPGLSKTKDALGLIGKQPVMGMIMLLAPVLTKIVEALKDNETALGAIDKLLNGLKPVMGFLSGILEKIAGWLAQAVEWVLELAKNSGISFNKIVAGAVGVGNALKEFLLIPIRNTIDGAKALGNVFSLVFKGQFKEAAQAAKQAVKDIGDNFKQGFSFKANYLAGVEAGEAFVNGLTSPKAKKAAQTAGKTIAEEVHKGALIGWEEIRKRMEAGDKRREEEMEETARLLLGLDQETLDYVNSILDEFEKEEDERLAREQERQEARQRLLFTYADTVSSVLGSIADMYEADEEEGEKNAAKVKALRTASAIIDTISGAISAYMGGVKALGGTPAGIALGIAQAATVLAAGMANIKKIQATKVGNGGDGSSASTADLASAPSYSPAIAQVHTVTNRSETERLNRMAADNRVYLVYSDLEVANTRQRVRVQETEF